MKPPSRRRKVSTVLIAMALTVVFLYFGAQALIISGTKASFSFVPVGIAPPGGATSVSAKVAGSSTTTSASNTQP